MIAARVGGTTRRTGFGAHVHITYIVPICHLRFSYTSSSATRFRSRYINQLQKSTVNHGHETVRGWCSIKKNDCSHRSCSRNRAPLRAITAGDDESSGCNNFKRKMGFLDLPGGKIMPYSPCCAVSLTLSRAPQSNLLPHIARNHARKSRRTLQFPP